MTKQEIDGLNKWQRYRLKDVDAYREMKREYAKTEEQKKKRREYMRIWRDKNREKHNQSARESHQRNKHKHIQRNREWHLMKKYGITQGDYDQMFKNQDGKCLICKTEKPAGNVFHVDHCHKTGKVRGLLCSRCNGALGWYEKYTKSILSYAPNS